MNTPADIAVIIPVWHHSALVSEAIQSCLDQKNAPAFEIILVNDGCDYEQTRQTLAGWQAAHPDRITLLSQSNQGLSAARNTGIEYALQNLSLRAVFFLDADNRLDPHALALFARLLDDDPQAGWFYPQLDMFGLEVNLSSGGPFSLSRLAYTNFSDAGSLVRRAVLDTGLRFDTDFKVGFEDWDFWLGAVQRGFTGVPIMQNCFRYRKRPESMLSSAHQSAEALRNQLMQKHRWLYGGHVLEDTWLREWPRFAFFDTDGTTRLGAGFDAAQPIDNYPQLYHQHSINPFESTLPPVLVFYRPEAFVGLNSYKLLDSVLYQLEGALRKSPFAGVTISDGGIGVRQAALQHDKTGGILERFDILAVSRHHLTAAMAVGDMGEMIDYLVEGVLVTEIQVTLPEPAAGIGSPLDSMVGLCAGLKEAEAETLGKKQLANWRRPADVHWSDGMAWDIAQNNAGGRPRLFPRGEGRQVGFVCPVFQFGGTEKCAVALARELAASGTRCHLFVYGNDDTTPAAWMYAPFETVTILRDPRLRNWDGATYLGTSGAVRPDAKFLGDMIGPMTALDAVVNCGSGVFHHACNELRNRGIKTVTWEHLTESTPLGRSFGTPFLAIAHEAGYDHIATCSNQLADRIAGQGVPRAKLMPMPNGPGFPADEPAECTAGAKLRVGFLGRFEAQKGLDRFLEIADALRDGPFAFSLRGGAVIGNDLNSIPDWLDQGPPLHSPKQLQSFLSGVDVLVLPSRDEGLPLTILEAQRAGAVPMASDVGAVSEAIEHDVTGILLPADTVVASAIATLETLAINPETLTRLRKAALGKPDRWHENARIFTDQVFGGA